MPDNMNDRGPQDRSRISLKKDRGVQYWAKKVGVMRAELEEAVKRADASAEAVAKQLGKQLQIEDLDLVYSVPKTLTTRGGACGQRRTPGVGP